MKLKILLACGCLLMILFLAFLLPLPLGQVVGLKHSYIAVNYHKGKVTYKITQKRPSGWVSFHEVNKLAARAIMISEDSFFYTHDGVDLQQLQMAFEDHFMRGKKMRGASTITQQLVKNLFLTHERSIFRKMKEFFLALYLEAHLEKNRIFEIYLNIIEFGEGLYGIKKSSYFYFNKHPYQLNAREGAFLAMLLPGPKRYSQSFRQKKLTPYAFKIIKSLLKKLVVVKLLTQAEFKEQLSAKFSWEAQGLRPGGGNAPGEDFVDAQSLSEDEEYYQ